MRCKKLWAVVIAVGLFVGWPRSGAGAEPASRPELRETVQLAQWDVLLNESGLDTIKQLESKPVQTGSKVYEAMLCNAAALRWAVAQAKQAGGVDNVAQSMTFTQNRGGPQQLQPLYFNYQWDRETTVAIRGIAEGWGQVKAVGDDQVHLRLNYPQVRIQVREPQPGTSGPESSEQSILYDGQLGAGESLAFIGTFTTPSQNPCYHLVVWEAFKAAPWQMETVRMLQDVDWWYQNGPEGLQKTANQAVVWAAAAKHEASQVPPGFEQKLEDGKVVAAVGMCQLDQWPFCWWDGLGQPVAAPQMVGVNWYALRHPFWAALTLRGPEQAWSEITPTGHPSENRDDDSRGHGPYEISEAFTVDQPGRIVVGIPVGPWQQVGQINVGGFIAADGTRYRLQQTWPAGDNGFVAQFYSNYGSENLVTLTAVLQDGTEVDPASYSVPAMVTIRRNDVNPQFNRIHPSQVKTFHVWKRKRQWVTINGFAAQPEEPPTADVPAAQLAAAVEAMQKRSGAGEMPAPIKSMSQQLKEFEALAAEPKTPMGAMRVMLEAGKKGDFAAVRHRLICSQDDPDKLLDLMARWIVASMSLQAQAVARFGQDTVFQDAALLFMNDCEMGFAGGNWVSAPGGGLRQLDSAPMAIVKGSDGEYYLDMSKSLTDLVKLRPYLLMRSQKMEQVAQMLRDNPAMTLGQFDAAMLRPATRPTTQKSGT